MPTISLKYKWSSNPPRVGDTATLSSEQFESFGEQSLGLDMSRGAETIDAVAAILDLEGFTDFCNQRDPHLVVPRFFKKLLAWLFEKLRKETKEEENNETVSLYCPLPFFAKFTGDGVLFLWNTRYIEESSLFNIVYIARRVAFSYRKEFLPQVKTIRKVPQALRCGVARGHVIRLGDGADYVGSCINIAARLQRLFTLRFAVSASGLESLEEDSTLVLKRVSLRGISDDERVFIRRSEYDKLASEVQAQFGEP